MRVFVDECVDWRLARNIVGHEVKIAVIVLRAVSNCLADLQPLVSDECHPCMPAAQTPNIRRREMTLCPIAMVVGCKKCPAFTVCPVKSVIGDYKKQYETRQQAGKENRKENKMK